MNMNNSFTEVQNDWSNGAEYHTFAQAVGSSHAYGFVCVSVLNGFVCHVSFDSAQEYAEMVGADANIYVGLECLMIGEQIDIDDSMWVRLW